MTIADDPQNPKPGKKPAKPPRGSGAGATRAGAPSAAEAARKTSPAPELRKSIDAISALRQAMEQRLKESGGSEPPATIAETSAPAPEPETRRPAAGPDGTATTAAHDPAEWSRIMFRIAERSQKLVLDFIGRSQAAGAQPPLFDPVRLGSTFAELTARIFNDPARFVDAHIALWQGYAQIWQAAIARMQGQQVDDLVKPSPADRRFQDEEWRSNWLFDLLKQFYLLTAGQMRHLVQQETRGLDPKLARKMDFMTRQIADAASPSNFWLTNPEVLRTIYKTGGESLIKGLENLLADLESGRGELRIRMTDADAFRLGDNLAATPGKVIYQNRLIQLIQYDAATPEVRRVPLLILPPWINKYYILDLRAKNSFIGWLVAQGYTVFCVSWVNPDKRHAAVDFDDYMTDGALAAMRKAAKAARTDEINMVGYCIGGTLLASTLAYLKKLPDRPPGLPRVNSATYLVTMTDFSDPGDLGNFMDEDLIAFAEEKMAKQGYMDAASMAAVFNMLRANDLIWSYVVNNYLLGKDPSPFDILYWNSDSTNMPAAMQRTYIRDMYVRNKLIEPNAVCMKGVAIDLRTIDTPTFMLSTREDHIAPWKSTYAATQIYGSLVTFMLAASGHIAGVVNPPAANKYGYWTNAARPASPEAWLEGAQQHDGSWWPAWLAWLDVFAGDAIPARAVTGGLEDAPGSYVKVRAV